MWLGWSSGSTRAHNQTHAYAATQAGHQQQQAVPRRPTIHSTDNESSLFSGYEYDEEFELLVSAFLRDMNHTTLSQASLNIAYASINVGIVALPYSAQESGIALFVATMVAGALVSAYTSIIVISMANQQRVRTLEDLAERAFGPRGFFAVSGFQILYSFCLMCVTLLVCGDIMSDSFISLDVPTPLLRSRRGMVLIGAIFILPLSLFKRSMSSLKWTSYVTVFAVMAGLIAVMATYFKDREAANKFFVHTSANELFRPKVGWFSIVFLSAFVYSSNQKVLTIYSSLRRRTAERWRIAVTRAYSGVTILYVLFAIAGYVAKSRENIRLDTFNFFVDSSEEIKSVFDPARIMVAVSLLLTIPGDSLVATTTWRRIRSKYLRSKIVLDSEMGNGSFGNAKTNERSILLSSSAQDDEHPSNSTLPTVAVQTTVHSKALPNKFRISRDETNRPSTASTHSNRSSLRSSNSYRSVPQEDKAKMSPDVSGYIQETDSLSDSLSEDARMAVNNPTLATLHSVTQSALPEEEGPNYDCHFNQPAQSKESSSTTNNNLLRTITPEATQRLASVDDLLDVDTPELPSIFPSVDEVVPTLFFWFFCVGVALLIDHWLYIVATVGTISILMLMFFFPSMLYFRLGLLSDFQAKPLFASYVPNRVYMNLVNLMGIAVLVFDTAACVCFVITRANLAEKDG